MIAAIGKHGETEKKANDATESEQGSFIPWFVLSSKGIWKLVDDWRNKNINHCKLRVDSEQYQHDEKQCTEQLRDGEQAYCFRICDEGLDGF